MYLVFKEDPNGGFEILKEESSNNLSQYFNMEHGIYFYSYKNNIINSIIEAKEPDSDKKGFLFFNFSINGFIYDNYNVEERNIWRKTPLYSIESLNTVLKHLRSEIYNYRDTKEFEDLYLKHTHLISFEPHSCCYFTVNLLHLMNIHKLPIGLVIAMINIKDLTKKIPKLSSELDMNDNFHNLHLTQIVQINNKFYSLERNITNFLFPINGFISFFTISNTCNNNSKCLFYILPQEGYTHNFKLESTI